MFVAVIMVITAVISASVADYERLARLKQPSVSHTFAAGELGVVNFKTAWGDKTENVAGMVEYVEEAHQAGVKILLFPEMCVTGYVSSSDPDSVLYKTAVGLAETVNGPTAKTFAKLADDYDMWIVYGATEVVPGDSEYAYNSAFAATDISILRLEDIMQQWAVHC